MQKKIIALAIAGLASTAAFAQTNVTIYGIADVGVAQTRSNGNLTQTAVISGGLSTSRIGFKGVEDLGNGLKALFTLEYRLDLDKNATIGSSFVTTGANASGPARQQFVGLTGGFGTVIAGRLQTTAFDWQGKYITLAATAFDAHNKLTVPNFRINLQNDARAENAIAYVSPSFGGVTVNLNHAFAVEQPTTATAGNLSATLVGVYYDNGPLSIGFVGEKLQGGGQAALGASTYELTERTDLALGASYDFGFAKFTGAYQTTKNNASTATGDTAKFDSVYSIGAQVPVSAKGKVHVQFAQSNYKSGIYSTGANAGTGGHLADNSGKGISVAYTHDLSKRTTVYAGYSYLDNAGTGIAYNYGTAVASPSTGAAGTGQAGGSSNVIAAGLRHSF
ncbi:MAG: porin [Azonexaceae bacterium]|nr:porin [Azonexaceae bacterium]